MKSMKNLGRAVSGVAASVKKAAPMMVGAAAKAAQPMSTQARTRMPGQTPLVDSRSRLQLADAKTQSAIAADAASKAVQARRLNESNLARSAALADAAKMKKIGRMATASLGTGKTIAKTIGSGLVGLKKRR